MLLHIGLDDTDSPRGGCTTYIAALLVERLIRMGARFADYPNLVRLNPNVPWKTRGNGAVCLRIEIEPSDEDAVKKIVLEAVESNSDFSCDNTNPGVVFHEGEVPEPLKEFSRGVIRGIATLDGAEALAEEHSTETVGYKNGRGIIGALAAVGERLEGDHTFEFLAYRTPKNRGQPRRLDWASVREMDRETRGETFNNLDPETGRVLIAPRGPDPVLFGVRGESAESVRRAGTMVRSEESIERWVIFRTNHGTDAHLAEVSSISELRPHIPAVVIGEVEEGPRIIRGGHIVFSIGDGTGQADCAAYEPTGRLREAVIRLASGDEIKAFGGVRRPDRGGRMTLNLEKLEVMCASPTVRLMNPACPNCGRSMESAGRLQGYRCRRCGHRARGLEKRFAEIARSLAPGLYIASPRAQRHLTKPVERYGREKRGPMPDSLCEHWHWP